MCLAGLGASQEHCGTPAVKTFAQSQSQRSVYPPPERDWKMRRSQRPAAADPPTAVANTAPDDTPSGPAQGKTVTVTLRIEWCVRCAVLVPRTRGWVVQSALERASSTYHTAAQRVVRSWLPAAGFEDPGRLRVATEADASRRACITHVHIDIQLILACSPATCRAFRQERGFFSPPRTTVASDGHGLGVCAQGMGARAGPGQPVGVLHDALPQHRGRRRR